MLMQGYYHHLATLDHTSSFGSKVMFASSAEVLQHILLKERDELRAQLDIDVADEVVKTIFTTNFLLLDEF